MATYQRNEIVPGLFILAAVAVFGLFAFRIGRWEVLDFLKGDRLHCRTVFDEVKTLAIGARVAVAGRRVGEVRSLRWTEQAYTAEDLEQLRRQLGQAPPGVAAGDRHLVVEVDFELADADLRIDPQSAQVALVQEGLLGQYFLDLYPGYWEEGANPPTIHAAGFEEPVLVRARRAAGLDALAATIGDAVGSITMLTETLNEGVFSVENRENLTALLRNVNSAVEQLAKLVGDEGEGGLRASALQPMRRALESLTTTSEDLRTRLLGTTLPKAEQVLDESRGGVQEFRGTLATLQRDLADVLQQLEATMLEVRPDLAESTRRLRAALWQAELALRKIRFDPSVLFWGSSEEDLEAPAPGGGTVTPTGRARIYQQRDEHATGK